MGGVGGPPSSDQQGREDFPEKMPETSHVELEFHGALSRGKSVSKDRRGSAVH